MESRPVKTRSSFIRNKHIEYRRQFLEAKGEYRDFSKHLDQPKKAGDPKPDHSLGKGTKKSETPPEATMAEKSPEASSPALDASVPSSVPTLESLALPENPAGRTAGAPVSDSRLLNKLSQFRPYIKEAAARYNLPEALIAGIIWQESRGNERAVSHCGAQGCMQLMPGTARQLGVTNAFDPRQNIDGGAKYIRQMLDKFGRVDYAIAAYNAGPGNVSKFGGIPPFKETQDYVPKVLAGAQEFKIAGGFPESMPTTALRV